MPNSYHRYAITVPEGMAVQIDAACQVEGRNRSEFFREAVRHYLTAKLGTRAPQFVVPTAEEELRDDPFRLFREWNSEADAAYDVLR